MAPLMITSRHGMAWRLALFFFFFPRAGFHFAIGNQCSRSARGAQSHAWSGWAAMFSHLRVFDSI